MRRNFKSLVLIIAFLLSARVHIITAQRQSREIKISNNKIALTLNILGGQIKSEKFSVQPEWAEINRVEPFEITSDGNFKFDLMWTYWDAPGKKNNADLELTIEASDFKILKSGNYVDSEGSRKINLVLSSRKYPFEINVEYSLKKDAFFVRKTFTISDTLYSNHFLENFHAYYSKFYGAETPINTGGFGQPAAFKAKSGGVFAGVEYPVAVNTIEPKGDYAILNTREDVGEKITADGITLHSVVVGLATGRSVKFWFEKYLNDIRAAEVVPYTLYNSWYDLRSVEYPNVPENFWMNEKNVNRIIDKIKKNFIDDHGISVDAVVLDDGWDIYESDWQLRKKQFPNGLRPIADKLSRTNTSLGIWFGPTGGYSFRMKRIKWMKRHGYEVVGKLKHNWQPMLCLAGKKYKQLFKKRVSDFVKNDKVAYFKWDGIQFSCSEPGHGHPVGLYSRRAVMESVEDICNTVRKLNPNIFLNITSGTWLSPWWLKYANTIWMQGGDYGYSNVPSISRRDRAITYRDITLYNDFTVNNFWFPISGLMTHGIIKGELQKLGGEAEPLDKFTDNAALYFARGVSMYELYISPDILTKKEWDAIAKSLNWAKLNFDILKNTAMVGGNPEKSEPYGYAHFNGDKGIIAVRNPKIMNDKINIKLSSGNGLNFDADNLILQELYPRKITFDKLYKADDEISVSLEGFETAIYRIFPVSDSDEPLICGAEIIKGDSGDFTLIPTGGDFKIICGLEKISIGGKNVTEEELRKMLVYQKYSEPIVDVSNSSDSLIKINFIKPDNIAFAEIAIFIKPDEKSDGEKLPELIGKLNNGKISFITEKEKGNWSWNSVKTDKTNNYLSLKLKANSEWSGEASIYLIYYEKTNGIKIKIKGAGNPANLLPRPWENGLIKKTLKVKSLKI